MFTRSLTFALAVFVAIAAIGRAQDTPPEPRREFRGAWVASVFNLDWPSRTGLSAKDQKAELITILDRLLGLKMNAVILQVRPQCDALYASQKEPWSSFLSGSMGEDPGYDPLAFAIEEAHARGLELHAWFNPFRALATASAAASSNHVTKTHPEWIRSYGNQLWLDPGEPAAREHALGVILDVVRRYDIDGTHIDDYFYPYPTPEKDAFPDDLTYIQYRNKGGKLAREDWRRDNINRFVEQLYDQVKQAKRGVKVGISPFGIWRPGVPDTIEAKLDSFGDIYADSRLWLREGWCDYLAPQLYWGIEPAAQSFPTLLTWWAQQNQRSRHLWPGVATDRVGAGRAATEIINQLALTRRLDGASGHIHWNAKALSRDREGIRELLTAGPYQQFALVPVASWLEGRLPQDPTVTREKGQISWRQPNIAIPRWWLVQTRVRGKWTAKLQPGANSIMEEPAAEIFAVRGIDATGLASDPTVVKLR